MYIRLSNPDSPDQRTVLQKSWIPLFFVTIIPPSQDVMTFVGKKLNVPTSPNEPAYSPFNLHRCACEQSSITGFLNSATNFFMSGLMIPPVWTIITASISLTGILEKSVLICSLEHHKKPGYCRVHYSPFNHGNVMEAEHRFFYWQTERSNGHFDGCVPNCMRTHTILLFSRIPRGI